MNPQIESICEKLKHSLDEFLSLWRKGDKEGACDTLVSADDELENLWDNLGRNN